MDASSQITMLNLATYFVLFLILIFVMVYFLLANKKTKTQQKPEREKTFEDENQPEQENAKAQNYGKFQGVLTRESIKDFMEFDEVVDNMIVRKKGTQYIMVLQCNGVNYDLMSEQEKISVEAGFVQFLNTLRFPIQLYVQSRTLNLVDIILEYKSRIEELNIEIQKIDMKIDEAIKKGNRALKEKLEFEKRRKINILEYGISITDYVEKLGSNKNILQQKTYVVVSYYSSELGGGIEKYSKEELYNMCFSELYTRCQNIASSLSTSQVTSSILDSEELAELLYIAYNRDESEVLQLSKMLNAQYDSLYSSGKDVLDKKKEKLDREINIEAIDIATASLLKADKLRQIELLDRQLEKNRQVEEKALELLDTYQDQLDDRVYELAKDEVKKTMKKKNDEENAKENSGENDTNVVKTNEAPKKKIVRRKKEEI